VIGNGSFQDNFPKKKFIRALASRGVTVVLDEYNTFKMCPCGLCELRDTVSICPTNPDNLHRRPRCHKAAEPHGPCSAIRPFLSRGLHPDRDELADIQMLNAGALGMCAGSRPMHLCSAGIWKKRRLG
jgi:hypothetical protein